MVTKNGKLKRELQFSFFGVDENSGTETKLLPRTLRISEEGTGTPGSSGAEGFGLIPSGTWAFLVPDF